MSILLEQPRPSSLTCVHDRTEPLGNEGAATFYRCVECGSVVILQGGFRWVLKAAPLA